jgi:hypothetical protein
MYRTNNRIVYLLVFVWSFSIILGGCAYLQSQVLSPKQTLYWGMNVYNGEWDRYIRQTVKPEYVKEVINDDREVTEDMVRTDLSEEQWEILRKKKEILSELYPVVQMIDETLNAGGMPPEETRNDLISLINRLIGE